MRTHTAVLLAAVALAPASARAEWELAPFAGVRGGGQVEIDGASGEDPLDVSAAYGLAAGWRLDREGWVDVLWSHQGTEFDADDDLGIGGSFGIAIDHLHAGASYRPAGGGRAAPFVSATVGLTAVRPDASGFDDDVSLSLGIHGGGDFALSARTAIRLAARGWLIFDEAVLAGTCGGAGCEVRIAAGGGFQLEGVVGLVIRFPGD